MAAIRSTSDAVINSCGSNASQPVELEADTASFIDGPFEQIGTTLKDSKHGGHDVKARVAVELRGENLGLQVLVEHLAQHLLIKADAVKPGPDRGRPTRHQLCQRLGKLEQARQLGIDKLMRPHPSDRQGLRRRDDVRSKAATQVDPLDLPELGIWSLAM